MKEKNDRKYKLRRKKETKYVGGTRRKTYEKPMEVKLASGVCSECTCGNRSQTCIQGKFEIPLPTQNRIEKQK